MKRLTALTAAAVAAATLTATAGAALPDSARTLMAHRATTTPARQLQLADRTIKKARDVLGFLDSNPAAGTGLSRLRIRHDYGWLLRFGKQERAKALARIRLASLPAHDALWECIHPREAVDPHNQDTGGNGHYGGLQMTLNWLGIVPGNPASYSWLQQKQFAETGYRKSGYSRSWLQGQWGQTVGPCWGFA